MTALWTVLRWIAFTLSLCGWFCLTACTTKLKSAFVPVFTVVTLTLTLFLCGLIHLLQPAAWTLFFLGIALLILFVVLAICKKVSLSFLYSPGLIFFFVASAVFIPILWGAHYYHYDNFSHWGTVLSEMLAFNDFPNAHMVVVFRDYAPATTSFLYWFCTIVGIGEDIALMGQAMLSCAALTVLFFRIKKVATFRFLAYSILAVVLTCLLVFDDGTLQVYNLLVDALMGFLAIAVWYLRDAYRENRVQGWLFITPLISFLMIVKSNAVLLIAFFAVIFFYDCCKARGLKWKRLLFLLPFGGMGLMSMLWNVYRDLTYGTDTNSYAYGGFLQTFRERTWSFYQDILRLFWDKITDFSKIYVVFFVVVNLMVFGALLLLIYRKKDCRYLYRTWIAANVMIVGYAIALMFMYGFIMAIDEARNLAAFERYMMTPLIFFVGMLGEAMITTLAHILEKRSVALRILPVCMALLLFAMVSGQAAQLVVRPDFASTERGLVIDELQEAARIIPRNSRVAMCNGERGRRDLYYYLMMYELKTRVCFDLDFGNPEYGIPVDVKMLEHYDYLIISVRHYLIVSELHKAGYTITWDPNCSVYRIREAGNGSLHFYPAKTDLSN